MNWKRILAVACVLWLLAGGVFVAASTHNAVFEGKGVKLGDAGKLSFSGRIGGELNGYFNVSVTYNRETNSVESGEWTVFVLDSRPDHNRGELGRLHGSVGGGSLTIKDDGALASVDDLQLTITEGTGDYAAISSGGGSFNARAGDAGAPTFVGDIQLTF